MPYALRAGMTAPLVSVVVPAFRAGRAIGAAVGSVFEQSFRNFELIVVNDGSPDTSDLEAAIAPFRDRLHYVVRVNGGAGAARNEGVRHARGDYIAFLDADDEWLPQFLAEQVAFLERTPACDLVYCDAIISGDSPHAGRRFMESAPSAGPVTLESLLRQQCNVLLSGVVVHADALQGAGLFDPAFRRGQDFDLWLRMVHAGADLQYQRKVLVKRRERPADVATDLERVLRVLEKVQQTMTLPPAAVAAARERMAWAQDRLYLEHAKQQLMAGDYAGAKVNLAAVRDKPLKVRASLGLLAIAPGLLRGCLVCRHRVRRRHALTPRVGRPRASRFGAATQ